MPFTSQRPGSWLWPLIALLSLPFLIWLSLSRFATVDEGFYLLAGQLVAAGKTPYRDFFYPQMPFLPYLFAGWFSLVGSSWESARVLAAIFCAIQIACVGHLAARNGQIVRGLVAITLLIGSEALIGWFSSAKPYVFATTFTVAALVAWSEALRDGRSPRTRWLFAAGVLLACAVSVRLYFVVLFPIFLFAVPRARHREILAPFLLGATVVALPHCVLFALYPEQFVFNNLGYHLIRVDADSARRWSFRLNAFTALFGLRPSIRIESTQFLFLSGVALCGAVIFRRWRCLSLQIAAALVVVSFVPVPVHLQYFSVAIPFLCLEVAAVLAKVLTSPVPRLPYRLSVVLLILCLFFLPGTISSIDRFTRSGLGVRGVESDNEDTYTLGTLARVRAVLNAEISKNEEVLSQWPGYLVGVRAHPVPRTENQFWLRVATKMSATDRKEMKIVNMKEFRSSVRENTVEGVVVHKDRRARFFPRDVLPRSHFVLKDRIEGIEIWVRSNRHADEKRL